MSTRVRAIGYRCGLSVASLTRCRACPQLRSAAGSAFEAFCDGQCCPGPCVLSDTGASVCCPDPDTLGYCGDQCCVLPDTCVVTDGGSGDAASYCCASQRNLGKR
jgi:hypothetical protein